MTNDVLAAHSDKSISLLTGLKALCGHFDLAIFDLWGVIHNGLTAFPAAINAVEEMRNSGCETVFLSNAPRPRTHVRQQLSAMGVPQILTNHIVTSGGLARDAVRENWTGAKLYHLGPREDHNTISGLDVTQVENPDEADIIFATGLDYRDVEQHRTWLRGAAENQVPFLCANPDRVVHVGERLYLCAGAVADLYAEMDGPVHWFGKPTASALLSCAAEAGITPPQKHRVIMIGDSLQTDIAGAKAAGYASALVTSGIHREDWPLIQGQAASNKLTLEAFEEIFGDQKPKPDFIVENVNW